METSRTRLCITGQVELLTVVPRSLDGEPNNLRHSSSRFQVERYRDIILAMKRKPR